MESKQPCKVRIWNTATISRKQGDNVLREIWNVYERKKERPRKSDFSEGTYKSIFWYFGSMRYALEKLGLQDLPDKRPWMSARKFRPEGYEKEYAKKWNKEHADKRREYALKAWRKLKTENPERYKEIVKRGIEMQKIRDIQKMKECALCNHKIRHKSICCHGCWNKLRVQNYK